MGRELTREEWAEIRRQQGRATSPDPAETPLLLSYQVEIERQCEIFDVVAVEKSRRTGATWGAAAGAVVRSASARGRGGMDTLYMGTSADMAREFIDAAANWSRLFDRAIENMGEDLFDDGSEDGIKAMRIDYASGFSIVALSSKPRSLRGRQGFAILDEAAFVDDLKALLQAALAFLIWGGKVLIISTHNGAANPFNQLVQDIRGGRLPYGLVRFDLDDALRAGLYERICLVNRAKEGDWSAEKEAVWRENLIRRYGDGADEELYCVPSASGGAVLSRVLIEARASAAVPVLRFEQPASFALQSDEVRRLAVAGWCVTVLAPVLATLDRTLQHALGVDFGRVADLSVFWPLAVAKNLKRTTPFLVELRNIPFEQQKQIGFFVADRLPRFLAAKLDATGNGAYLAEVFAQRYGEGRVEQVKLSVGWYLENVPPFKAALEDGMVDVPADADVVTDLATPVYKNGIASIPPVRTQGQDGLKRHADSFVAGVLAYAASRSDAHEYAYRAAPGLDRDPERMRMRADEDDDVRALPAVGRLPLGAGLRGSL